MIFRTNLMGTENLCEVSQKIFRLQIQIFLLVEKTT